MFGWNHESFLFDTTSIFFDVTPKLMEWERRRIALQLLLVVEKLPLYGTPSSGGC